MLLSMNLRTPCRDSHILVRNPKLNQLCTPPIINNSHIRLSVQSKHCKLRISSYLLNIPILSHNQRGKRVITQCIGRKEEVLHEECERFTEITETIASVSPLDEVKSETIIEEFDANVSIWDQMVEILKFSGPAAGLWICGPLMSLIDTVVIGQGSSLELAALGPATVVCDYMAYIFMFLSIATSNLVATSLARQDKEGVQHQISTLLFIGLACGVIMLIYTKVLGAWTLTSFIGPKNVHMVPAANTYVQIRGLAWPAILVGWVAQSASLGMKDSWGPLKALAVASAVNGIGDVILCTFLGYGIAGAAWATMVSQIIAAYMMIEALNKKGFNAFLITVPSSSELFQILMLAAPVFVTMSSKVAFYSLIIYFATSMGTTTIAAHQVMSQIFGMCAVWGEPLSQTAQSFMPELLYGIKRDLVKARTLLKSLVIIGLSSGLVLGSVGLLVPLLFPQMFSPDSEVILEMRKVLVPYFMALCVTPGIHSLEGTLLAGRDLKFLSLSMSGCFSLGALFLWFASTRQFGLVGCWFGLVGFQWSRFAIALRRLLSPTGILYSEDLTHHQVDRVKAS
ncbi:protein DETOXIFICATION 46, chloroplastic [Impatiens glandulifera]|uniref:protein DETOXIFICATION 46, chloroplastic n=1 Tax=Impatiens glandulifera TaxID=253017 RepID=UPI001FB1867C|nr:protein DETOXIFICATION 46, chloroplastic [Impatiens glandulifera]